MPLSYLVYIKIQCFQINKSGESTPKKRLLDKEDGLNGQEKVASTGKRFEQQYHLSS